jgi:hypothetical protein
MMKTSKRKSSTILQKERENNMKQYLSQNAEKIDSTTNSLGNKNSTLSFDDLSNRDMDAEKGEEFEFDELEYSELLPPIVSKQYYPK